MTTPGSCARVPRLEGSVLRARSGLERVRREARGGPGGISQRWLHRHSVPPEEARGAPVWGHGQAPTRTRHRKLRQSFLRGCPHRIRFVWAKSSLNTIISHRRRWGHHNRHTCAAKLLHAKLLVYIHLSCCPSWNWLEFVIIAKFKIRDVSAYDHVLESDRSFNDHISLERNKSPKG